MKTGIQDPITVLQTKSKSIITFANIDLNDTSLNSASKAINSVSEFNYQRCGNILLAIGEDICEQLKYVPSSFRVIRHVRPKHSCTCCSGIVQAPAPSRPIARSYAGPGLLAHVAVVSLPV